MLLTFIRHSKTKPTLEIPIPLWGLTDEGIQLAKDLTNLEEIKNVDILYSSLQTKALETAIVLSKNCSLPIKTNNDLTEITSFTKKFFGSPLYEENVDKFYSDEIDRIAEGETYEEALERFENALESIVDAEKEAKNIGIISHGNVLAFFTAKYTDHSPRKLHDAIKMPDVAVFDWESKQYVRLWEELR